jgi:hypothetical protein
MLNTSAGAGRLEATPQVGDYGYGSAQSWRRSRPGASAGRRLRCVAATSAAHRPVTCRVAGGELAAPRTSVYGGGDASGAMRAAGCQVGRVARPMMRRSSASLDAAVPAGRCSLGQAMLHLTQPVAPGCIAMSASATMMRATQRNQLHHRCIRSKRSVKSQVSAAARRPGKAEGAAGPHAAPQAARIHANCRMLHRMQLRALNWS